MQTLRNNYASITQIVYAKYADITQILLRSNFAIVSVLHNYLTQKLRRNYAKLNLYAYYAIFTQINYAEIRK